MTLDKNSALYEYLPEQQRDLLKQGIHLLDHVNEDRSIKFNDYSFVVFPFAKAYEGFLKQIFLDAGFITKEDYLSKYFRVGKVMSPNLKKRLGDDSVYKKICDEVGCKLSDKIWETWTNGRNKVFHYFPSNVKSLSLQEAEDIANEIVETMEEVAKEIQLRKVQQKLSKLSVEEIKELRSQA